MFTDAWIILLSMLGRLSRCRYVIGFVLLRHTIGLKRSYHFLIQSEVKAIFEYIEIHLDSEAQRHHSNNQSINLLLSKHAYSFSFRPCYQDQFQYIETHLHMFSRFLISYVFISRFDWFAWLSVSLVIGQTGWSGFNDSQLKTALFTNTSFEIYLIVQLFLRLKCSS